MRKRTQLVAGLGQIANFSFKGASGRVIFKSVHPQQRCVGVGFLFEPNGEIGKKAYSTFLTSVREFEKNCEGEEEITVTVPRAPSHLNQPLISVYVRGKHWCKNPDEVSRKDATEIVKKLRDVAKGLQVSEYYLLPILI